MASAFFLSTVRAVWDCGLTRGCCCLCVTDPSLGQVIPWCFCSLTRCLKSFWWKKGKVRMENNKFLMTIWTPWVKLPGFPNTIFKYQNNNVVCTDGSEVQPKLLYINVVSVLLGSSSTACHLCPGSLAWCPGLSFSHSISIRDIPTGLQHGQSRCPEMPENKAGFSLLSSEEKQAW